MFAVGLHHRSSQKAEIWIASILLAFSRASWPSLAEVIKTSWIVLSRCDMDNGKYYQSASLIVDGSGLGKAVICPKSCPWGEALSPLTWYPEVKYLVCIKRLTTICSTNVNRLNEVKESSSFSSNKLGQGITS